jgi:hypothetical protein
MTSFARLSAALGTIAVLATAGVGSASADSQNYNAASDVTTIFTDRQVINHWQTLTTTYSCPPGHLLVPQYTDNLGTTEYFRPIATGGDVIFEPSTLGNWNLLGSNSVDVTWTNWELTGDQFIAAIYQCTGNLDPAPATPTATPQSAPTQPTPSPTPHPTVPVGLTNLSDFHAAFTNGLPLLGGGIHRDPSADLLPGVQTPPDVAASGKHLLRVYAKPELIKPDQVQTVSAACPSGGLVAADPGVRSAEPYLSRVSSVNVSSSLANGDAGQSFLSVQFTNNGGSTELAAFQFVCAIPN